MNCLVCNEETELTEPDYCLAHRCALENITQAFDRWTAAYGYLSRPDFLQLVQKVSGTGVKAREIAHFLSENPSRWER